MGQTMRAFKTLVRLKYSFSSTLELHLFKVYRLKTVAASKCSVDGGCEGNESKNDLFEKKISWNHLIYSDRFKIFLDIRGDV